MTRPVLNAALNAQSALLQAAISGIRIMIVYRAIAYGADPAFLGVLVASFSLPALFAALPIGQLSDRIGGAPLGVAGLVLIVGGGVGMLRLDGLAALAISSAVVGLGQVSTVVGQQSIVAHASARNGADGAFGNLSAAASIGQLIGPPLITTIATIGARGETPNTNAGLIACVLLAAVALGASLVPLRSDRALTLARREAALGVSSSTVHEPMPGLWRALVVSGAVLATSDIVYAYLPLWAVENSVGVTAVGWLLALRAAVSVVSRFGLERLVTRFGRSILLVLAMLIGAVALVALPLSGLVAAACVMVGLGITLGLPQPLTMAWVVNIAAPASRGRALGLRLTANRLAQVTVPVGVGLVAAPLGTAGVFWATAALLAVATAVVPRRESTEGPPRRDTEAPVTPE